MDEQTAQVLAATLGDAHQCRSVAAGELSGHKSDPRSKMTSVLELGAVANGCYDRGGRLRPHALDPGDPLAGVVLAKDTVDLLIEGGDPTVEIAEEIVEFRDRLSRHRRELIVMVGQDLGGHR